jgi:hypothetical protein
MVSGSHGGDARRTIGRRARQVWPATSVVVTTNGCRRPVATALLRNQEVVLHPVQALRLRIAIVVSVHHSDCQSLYRRASWMLSEIVCSEARQNCRTTKGGAMATQATTIQFGTDVIPIAIAARDTAINQATKSSILIFPEKHETSVATGNLVRCSELHGVRPSARRCRIATSC